MWGAQSFNDWLTIIFSDIWMNIPSFYLQIHGYEHHFAQNDGKQDVTVVSNDVESSPTKRVKKAVEWTSEIWMLLVTGRRFRHQQSLTWYRVWGQWHLFRCTRVLPVLWSWILHLSSRNPSLNNFVYLLSENPHEMLTIIASSFHGWYPIFLPIHM